MAHNEFFNLRFLTLYPKEIIAVSHKVKENLISYFGLRSERIKVIYNGINDVILNKNEEYRVDCSKIKVLLPARINKVKQQVEVVNNLKGGVKDHIEIHFAGEGEEMEILKKITSKDTHFKVLGFVDISAVIKNYDYVLLYSKVEGLPTVLIEACMYAKPIICNDVGGNLEILTNNKNGFLVDNYEELKQKINVLPNRGSEEYTALSAHARDVYLDNFTFNKMIDNYVNTLV